MSKKYKEVKERVAEILEDVKFLEDASIEDITEELDGSGYLVVELHELKTIAPYFQKGNIVLLFNSAERNKDGGSSDTPRRLKFPIKKFVERMIEFSGGTDAEAAAFSKSARRMAALLEQAAKRVDESEAIT